MKELEQSSKAVTRRLEWLIRIIAIGTLINLLVTSKLWLSDRFYPLTPVFKSLSALPSPYDTILFYLLLFCLLLLFLLPRLTAWLSCCLLIMLFLALQDQSRWHPWFYWYFLFLFCCTLAQLSSEKKSTSFNSMQLFICFSYLWSGLQKLNIIFFVSVFPWFLSPIFPNIQNANWIKGAAIFIPLIECLIPICLMTSKWRQFALYLLTLLHLVIIICLGPTGHDVNSNVWPWNLTMITIVWLLFYKTAQINYKAILFPKSALHLLVLVIAGFMPLLSIFDRFDSYPSFALYSGTQKAAVITFSSQSKEILPPNIKEKVDSENNLKVSSWAMAELNTPDYAESRIYKKALAFLCDKTTLKDIKLTIYSKPERLSGKREEEEVLGCK